MIALFLLSSFVDAHRRHHTSKMTVWQRMNIKRHAAANKMREKASRVNAERHALADRGKAAYKRKEDQFKAAREGWRGEPQQEQR